MGSFAGGLVWDASGAPSAAFAPVALAGVAMIALALRLNVPAWMAADAAKQGQSRSYRP